LRSLPAAGAGDFDGGDIRSRYSAGTVTPKLIYSMGVSLDGYIAGLGGPLDWTAPDEELHRFAVGGAGVARSCIELGLIDEFGLFAGPVVLGGGTPFFPPSRESC